MLLDDLARTSAAVAASPSRLAKIDLIAAVLRRADPDEVPVAVAFLSGELRQRQIGVGWAALRDIPAPGADPTLTVGEVDAVLAEVGRQAGAGSQGARRALLHGLLARATADEQRFLVPLLGGELRQGALEGVMVEAVARAAEVAVADVRRALLLGGDLREVAGIALRDGAAGLAAVRLEVGRPLAPMLASPAADVAAALARTGPAAVEWKVDGARVQVHRDGDEVAVFTRTLDDITARVPEITAAALALPAHALVLDGEAVALRPDGRPHPFQVTAGRLGTRRGGTEVALTPFLFDLLHLDGEDLVDRPGEERHAALARVAPATLRIPRAAVEGEAEASAFLAEALARGHEGVMVKSLAAPYAAGRRGTGWLKVKPVHTLDLVVLAAEWGHGRRRGWLSNIHLGARHPAGGWVMLGKTFKGMTDDMLRWQTARFLELEVAREGHVVHLRPEQVVEIAFDGVQTSSRYPGGMALRFARVVRYRDDKPAADADTIATVRAVATTPAAPV